LRREDWQRWSEKHATIHFDNFVVPTWKANVLQKHRNYICNWTRGTGGNGNTCSKQKSLIIRDWGASFSNKKAINKYLTTLKACNLPIEK
jgi:hypothetical protein